MSTDRQAMRDRMRKFFAEVAHGNCGWDALLVFAESEVRADRAAIADRLENIIRGNNYYAGLHALAEELRGGAAKAAKAAQPAPAQDGDRADSLSKAQRYTLAQASPRDGWPEAVMVEDDAGDWILRADVTAERVEPGKESEGK